jgi:hypothetical protein
MTKSIRKEILTLEVGQSRTYSLDVVNYSTLRAYAYTIGQQLGGMFSATKAGEREMKITRLK